MVESRSIVSAPARSAGPAPAAHNPASSSRETASSWRTLCHAKARSQLPIVEGARVASNSFPVAPARSAAVSSMQSPPASIEPITVSALDPLLAPCSANSTRWSIAAVKPSRCANTAAGNSPADGTRFASSKLTDTRDRSWDACIRQVPSRLVDLRPQQSHCPKSEGI
jgi:hypothetical protein